MKTIQASWPALEDDSNFNVMAFTTTRQFCDKNPHSAACYQNANMGFHVDDNPLAVLNNRSELLSFCDVQDAQWLEQVHGTLCVKATRDNDVPISDACWTDEADLACIVMTADCLPVAMRQGENIGVAHAGWRGLLAGVLEQSLQNFNIEQTDIWLGPAIGPASFEVGEEVRDQYIAENEEAINAFVKSSNVDKWMADIYQLARIKLISIGIDATRIYGGEYCTLKEEESFFSYRRNAKTGRMATVIYRTKKV